MKKVAKIFLPLFTFTVSTYTSLHAYGKFTLTSSIVNDKVKCKVTKKYKILFFLQWGIL